MSLAAAAAAGKRALPPSVPSPDLVLLLHWLLQLQLHRPAAAALSRSSSRGVAALLLLLARIRDDSVLSIRDDSVLEIETAMREHSG